MAKYRPRHKKPFECITLHNLYGDRIPWVVYWSDRDQKWRKAETFRQIKTCDQEFLGPAALDKIAAHLRKEVK